MDVLKSKRFLATIGTLLSLLLVGFAGLDEATANLISTGIMGVAGAYILGQTVTDVATNGATSSQTAKVDLVEMKRAEAAVIGEQAKLQEVKNEAMKIEVAREFSGRAPILEEETDEERRIREATSR